MEEKDFRDGLHAAVTFHFIYAAPVHFARVQSRVDLIKIEERNSLARALISHDSRHRRQLSFKDLESSQVGETGNGGGGGKEGARVSRWDPRNRQEFRKK